MMTLLLAKSVSRQTAELGKALPIPTRSKRDARSEHAAPASAALAGAACSGHGFEANRALVHRAPETMGHGVNGRRRVGRIARFTRDAHDVVLLGPHLDAHRRARQQLDRLAGVP